LYRDLFWDESNRLRVVSDNTAMQHYIYDASGERVLKANSDMEAVYENGTLVNAPGTVSINGYTSYPSAFIVITSDGVYSKHYYAGSQRIVSRLGENDAHIFEPCVSCSKTTNTNFEDTKLQKAQKADLQQYANKAKKGTIVFKDYKPITLAEQEKALAEENEDKTKEKPGRPVAPIYYYHPDHLGTSTALTDFNGKAYQFFLNLPFGETMAQQLGSNYYNTPYKFNGKELDEETGFYYYGARYYDPRVSIWMSVDPLVEKYPNISPYVYVADNPIMFIDPDGKRIEFAPGTSAQYKKQFAQTVKYLNAHHSGGMLAKLQARKEVILIGALDEGSKGAGFSQSKGKISWNPTTGVKFEDGVKVSPASVLNHEVDHALDAVVNPKEHTENSKKGSDSQYDTKEERRVITGSEQETAKNLGEIKDGQVTRTDHKGTAYETTSPTTTKAAPVKPVELQEIIIGPRKKN
jgi:RHS repeat-associated protein